MNKYYKLLAKILKQGEEQKNKKGDIKYLINEVLSMTPANVKRILKEHPIAKKKLSFFGAEGCEDPHFEALYFVKRVTNFGLREYIETEAEVNKFLEEEQGE